jgi:hypothetical protein
MANAILSTSDDYRLNAFDDLNLVNEHYGRTERITLLATRWPLAFAWHATYDKTKL